MPNSFYASFKLNLHWIRGSDVIQDDASIRGTRSENISFDLVELDGMDGIDAPIELLHRQVPAGVPQHGLLAAGGKLLGVPVVRDASDHGLKMAQNVWLPVSLCQAHILYFNKY